MNIFKKYKTYFLFIMATILIGLIPVTQISTDFDLYDKLVKPALSPPKIIFPIVWTILYTLMGISASLIYLSKNTFKSHTLLLYIIQLLVNIIWPILFFVFKAYLLSFIWLLLLLILIIIMILKFYRLNNLAGLLQIPYLIWVLFAGYLNLMIYILN